MIEVFASLQRGYVYLSGETVECALTFRNTNQQTQSRNSVGVGYEETLAWSTAQIHCLCSVSEARVKLTKQATLSSTDVSTTASKTSFIPSKGEKGFPVLSTKPKVLFCNLELAPGESKTYMYSEELPIDAVPSFKGHSVKYSYKLTIGAQKLDCATELLKVPFKVLSIPALVSQVMCLPEPDDLRPSNPFLEHQRKPSDFLEISLERLTAITARKSPHYYNITNARGKVVRFCLFKQSYRIGDDIVGSFDFTDAQVPCVQFTASLKSQEEVLDDYKAKPGQQPIVLVSGKQHEYCLHTQRTYISIPVPLTATPGFKTDIVSLTWKLHFEFVTSLHDIPGHPAPKSPTESSTWRGPANLEVETMEWDLPITVYPTNPIHLTGVGPSSNKRHVMVIH